jgi:hypothetical protein
MLISSTNLYFQVIAILKPLTYEHKIINMIYTANSMICWCLLIQTFFKTDKLQRNIEVVLILLHIRNLIRCLDFENTRDKYEDDKYFYYLVNSQVIACFVNMLYLLVFLKRKLR